MLDRLTTPLYRLLSRLDALFGRGLVRAFGWLALAGLVVALFAFGFFDSAAPSSLTITTGPAGSNFQRTAEQYRKILARSGVTLHIEPSEGSRANLARLLDLLRTSPKTLEQLVEHRLLYPPGHEAPWVIDAETRSISQHLDELLADGRVRVDEKRLYRLR